MSDRVIIRLLGGFTVDVNGITIDESNFDRRHGALLVKLLALAAGRRLHREQVIDALWPEATIDEAGLTTMLFFRPS